MFSKECIFIWTLPLSLYNAPLQFFNAFQAPPQMYAHVLERLETTNFVCSFHVSISWLFLTIKDSDWEKTQNMHIEVHSLIFPKIFQSRILDENWMRCACFPSAAQNGHQNRKFWLYGPRWLSVMFRALILKFRRGSDKEYVTSCILKHEEWLRKHF